MEDADGYYGGSHNFWIYDEGTAGYVWLLDHTDSALEWVEVFTPTLGYKEHPIYWWAGRALPDPPAKNYLLVINDPTGRSQYVNAIATQVANGTPPRSWAGSTPGRRRSPAPSLPTRTNGRRWTSSNARSPP